MLEIHEILIQKLFSLIAPPQLKKLFAKIFNIIKNN